MIYGLLLVILPAGIAGYAVGFVAQKRIDRRIVPVALLALAIVLFTIWLFAADDSGDVTDRAQWIVEISFVLAVSGAASASWMFTRHPGIALATAAGLTLLVAYIWLDLAMQRICGVPGGCPF